MDISMPTSILNQTLILICRDVIAITSTYIIMESLSQFARTAKSVLRRYTDYRMRHLSMETALSVYHASFVQLVCALSYNYFLLVKKVRFVLLSTKLTNRNDVHRATWYCCGVSVTAAPHIKILTYLLTYLPVVGGLGWVCKLMGWVGLG